MCVHFQLFQLFFFQNITKPLKKVNENSFILHKCQKSKIGNGKMDLIQELCHQNKEKLAER